MARKPTSKPKKTPVRKKPAPRKKPGNRETALAIRKPTHLAKPEEMKRNKLLQETLDEMIEGIVFPNFKQQVLANKRVLPIIKQALDIKFKEMGIGPITVEEEADLILRVVEQFTVTQAHPTLVEQYHTTILADGRRITIDVLDLINTIKRTLTQKANKSLPGF